MLQKKEAFPQTTEHVPNRGYEVAEAAEPFVAHFWMVKQINDDDGESGNMSLKIWKHNVHGENISVPVLVNHCVVDENAILTWGRPTETDAKSSGKGQSGKNGLSKGKGKSTKQAAKRARTG